MHTPDVIEIAQMADKTLLYHPVPLATLKPNRGANFNLYIAIQTRVGQRYLLYKADHIDFTISKQRELLEKGVRTLYVSDQDVHQYFDYVDRTVGEVLRSERVSPVEKSQILYETTSSLMKSLYERPDSTTLMKTNQKMVTHTVESLSSEPEIFRNMVQLFAADYALYSHSVNVATLGAALMLQLDEKNETKIRDTAMGYLLHDIGKTRVPSTILRKIGILSTSEMRQIEQHPIYGVELMQQHEEIDPQALDVIMNHHEKLNGNGYPRKISGPKLSLEARVCSIVDIYDALTSARAYKPALSGYDALKIMMGQMSDEIDQELVRELALLLAPRKR